MADPQVMVSKGEVVQDTRVLAQHEVESLQQALGAHQQVLGATADGYLSGEQGAGPVVAPGMRVNRKRLSDQAQQIKKVLETASPEPIPESKRDAYAKRAKWLEDQFKPWLETREELHVLKRDRPAWQSAIKKAQERTRPNSMIEKYIGEWQSIQRRLNPHDPEADSLHRLRKDRD
jgi:hypothetical protein